MSTATILALVAAVVGYYGWQRGRYDRTVPAQAHARALIDTIALALILAGLWIGGWLAPKWGWIEAAGSPGATIGVLIAVLLAGPLRRALSRRLGIDPAGQM